MIETLCQHQQGPSKEKVCLNLSWCKNYWTYGANIAIQTTPFDDWFNLIKSRLRFFNGILFQWLLWQGSTRVAHEIINDFQWELKKENSITKLFRLKLSAKSVEVNKDFWKLWSDRSRLLCIANMPTNKRKNACIHSSWQKKCAKKIILI